VDAAQAMLWSHQAGDSTAWIGQQAANSGPVSDSQQLHAAFQLYHSGSA